MRRNQNKSVGDGVHLVDFDQLLELSDILTLHAPLTPENEGIINYTNLAKMKNTAILINTGRGALVNEDDLKRALINGIIAGAGLDVLSQEPPPVNHALQGLHNCIITPHHAWTAREARTRLIKIVSENIKSFIAGTPQNIVSI